MTRGIPKGTKLSPEVRRHMSEARQKSVKVKEHYERLKIIMKGRHPKEASASSLAMRALRRIGLTREGAPDLYESYYQFYLKQFEDPQSES